jgi:FG-GAP repeat/Secretion system C-terminal sorting domain
MNFRHQKGIRGIIFLILLLLPVISTAQDWDQVIKLVASDRGILDRFGCSVSISGDYAIIGAYLERHGLNETDSLYSAGSVYIFKNEGGTWIQKQKIAASDRDAGDMFGYAVAISGDYAIVGAYQEDHNIMDGDSLRDAGSAYIFMRSGETWTEQQKLIAPDRTDGDNFGFAVDLDGDYAIVGAIHEEHDVNGLNEKNSAGSVYIFMRSGSVWMPMQKFCASDRSLGAWFGFSVCISDDEAVIGALFEGQNELDDAGAAYVFQRSGDTWSQIQKLVASDRASSAEFGRSVSMDGEYIVVGAPDENYDTSGNVVPQAGAAYIYKRSGDNWIQQQKIFSSDRAGGLHLGYSVSISGDYVITGAPGPSETNIFKRTGDVWNEQCIITATDHQHTAEFGSSVFISGECAIVGAYHNDTDTSDSNPIPDAGAAYIFKPSSGTDVGSRSGEIPITYELKQNYPNPFNPETNLSFVISHLSFVRLKVYNALGEEITTLVEEVKAPGEYSVSWNLENLPGGVYFYRLTAGEFTQTKKMVLLK